MFDDSMIDTFAAGAFQTLETPLKATNVHARGGSVIPMQQFAMKTTAVRATPYTLLVALDGSQQAEGSLHVEDGVQLYLDSYATTTFSVKRDTIKATSEVVSYDNNEILSSIVLLGVSWDDVIVFSSTTCEGSLVGRDSIDAGVLTAHDNYYKLSFDFS
jgi:alpha-glucosidase (family GH31 glycosyl hydrolase)